MKDQCSYCQTPIDRQAAPVKTRGKVLEMLLTREGEERQITGLMTFQKPDKIKEGHILTTTECPACHKTILELNPLVPEDVAADVEEALLCFSVRAYHASMVMFRRAIQTCAVDLGGRGSHLVEQLDNLRSAGKISAGADDWTRVVRVIGNLGAHPGSGAKQDQMEDAEAAFLFSLAFAQATYVEAPWEYAEPEDDDFIEEFEMRHIWWGDMCVHELTSSVGAEAWPSAQMARIRSARRTVKGNAPGCRPANS